MAVREFERPPNLTVLYGKAVLRAALASVPGLRGGTGGRRSGDGLPDDELVLRDLALDPEHVAAYVRVCAFRLDSVLPPTYLHVAAFALAVQLMARPSFPFPLPGLVHVANRITQHRPVRLDERPTLRVRMGELQAHPKGQRFEVLTDATVDGATVWEEASVYLHRGGGDRDARAVDVDGPARSPRAPVWHVPADVGRRYAAVSGDRNPIHLHPLTARLFGFPSNIAHGMWTEARCLAGLEGRLPDALEVEVSFRKPLVLPADVAFTAERRDGGWAVSLHGAESDTPHLSGRISPR